MEPEITGATRIYVHLAHPNGHVRTPAVFNEAFRERRIDAIAVSVDVTPADLSPLVRGIRGWRNLAGIGVTMPHKQTIAADVDELVGLTRSIRSVNAIRREPDGRLVGTNTDGDGFVEGLRSHGHEPRGRDVLLVGIGGAGRAIAFALAQAGVRRLALSNRTPERAEEVARDLLDAFPNADVSAGVSDPADFDMVVNATPLGMRPGDPLPLDVDRLRPGTVVADVIMRPAMTRLLAAAEKKGCVIHPGEAMLVSQIDLVFDFLGLVPAIRKESA